MAEPTATPPLLFIAAIAAIAAGCGREPSHDEPPCPPPRPAFSLVIRAFDGRALASDTTVVVSSGWGEERFAMATPPVSPQSVFCHATPEQVACTLWTDGAAQVDVTSVGLAPASAELEAESNDCGVVTRDEELVLYAEEPPGGDEP